MTTRGRSFNEHEVDVVVQLLHILRRGGDVSTLLRHPELVKVERKFLSMQRQNRTPPPDEGSGLHKIK